jgi:hypothetical protein
MGKRLAPLGWDRRRNTNEVGQRSARNSWRRGLADGQPRAAPPSRCKAEAAKANKHHKHVEGSWTPQVSGCPKPGPLVASASPARAHSAPDAMTVVAADFNGNNLVIMNTPLRLPVWDAGRSPLIGPSAVLLFKCSCDPCCFDRAVNTRPSGIIRGPSQKYPRDAIRHTVL